MPTDTDRTAAQESPWPFLIRTHVVAVPARPVRIALWLLTALVVLQAATLIAALVVPVQIIVAK